MQSSQAVRNQLRKLPHILGTIRQFIFPQRDTRMRHIIPTTARQPVRKYQIRKYFHPALMTLVQLPGREQKKALSALLP
jgi:hypothetical protein